jgi:hypothetical protein
VAAKKRAKKAPKKASLPKARTQRAGRTRARARDPNKVSVGAVTDSGRHAAALRRVWAGREIAEQVIISRGVGVSATHQLMERCGLSRRVARTYQSVAYQMMAEESEREGDSLRIMRYRLGLERQVEAAMLDRDHRAVAALYAVLVKMTGGFNPRTLPLPGGRTHDDKPPLVGVLGAAVDATPKEPVRMPVDRLTEELVQARERGEDV